jgi:hypothetical protein
MANPTATGKNGEKYEYIDGQWARVYTAKQPEPRVNARVAAGQAVGETALSALTGAVATPVAGLAGLGASLIPGMNAADVVEGVQEGLTYDPRTGAGKQALETISSPFAKYSEWADAVGDFTQRHTGSAALATGARTLVEGAPDLLGLGALRGLRGLKPQLPRSPNADVNLLRDMDVPVTRAQAGSNAMQNLKLSADTILGPDDAFNATQRAAYNRAVLKEAGFSGDDISIESLGRFKRELNDAYDDLTSRVDTQVDQTLQENLAAIQKQAEIDLEPGALGVIKNQITNIYDKGGLIDGSRAAIPGTAAQTIRESLGGIIGEGGRKGELAKRIKAALDNAYIRGASPEDAAKMKDTRARYRTLEQLEGAMANNATGNVSPSKLYNVVDDRMNRGSGLLNVARAGKNVLPDPVGNSGTPARVAGVSTIASLLTNPVQALKTGATLGAGRVLNKRPDAGLVRPAGQAAGVAAAVSGSGDALLEEQRRLTDAYLQSIGAR